MPRIANESELEREMQSAPCPDLPEDIGLPLAATLGLTANKSDRIATEVRQAARAVFGKPARSRASTIPKELKVLLKLARKGSVDPSGIAFHLWPYLLVEDEVGIEELCASPADLIEAIQLAIEIASLDPETALSRKGGRHRDPRIDAFVMALAQIHRRYVGHRPTLTFDPETGHMVSPFGLFVFEAFSQVYRHTDVPEGAIQGAMKSIVWFERDTEPMSDEELESLLRSPAKT